jgi:hypothetical protein
MATVQREKEQGARTHRFMTVEEVAPLFRKSPKTIYRWGNDPKLLGTAKTPDPAGGVLFEASRINQLLELMAKGLLGK